MRLFANSKLLPALMSVVGLSACAHDAGQATAAAYDPFQPFNRKVFGANQAIDRTVVTPIARTYRRVAPRPARQGIQNFTRNLSAPKILVNDVLQFNIRRAGITVGRFGLNSTVGGVGLFDVASRMGLPYHDADFGQTLGRWGVPPGAPIQLPVLGPSDLRDAVGKGVGALLDPLSYVGGGALSGVRIGGGVAGTVDGRARLLPVTERLQARSSDYYLTTRDRSAQLREALVREAQTGAIVTRADAAPAVAVPDIP